MHAHALGVSHCCPVPGVIVERTPALILFLLWIVPCRSEADQNQVGPAKSVRGTHGHTSSDDATQAHQRTGKHYPP